MSVLDTPRIYFKGEISWDPITTNNYWQNYDEGSGEPIYTGLGFNLSASERVKNFRQRAIREVGGCLQNWNPHGTHRCSLFNTKICGADTGDGLKTDDPIVAIPVNLTGMLVDLEPYGGYTSQIFFDRMTFGVDGGYRILARRYGRFADRYPNFRRGDYKAFHAGAASVIWQTSFAGPEGVQIDAHDSLVLQKLQSAMQDPEVHGLTVRINAYRTVYYDDPYLINESPATKDAQEKLTDKLEKGGFQPNPARSLVVGVIGLWRKGEPAFEPCDRVMVQCKQPPREQYVATAFARAQGSKLVLDLGNSIIETRLPLAPPPALEKKNLGPLEVWLVDRLSGRSIHVGTVQYRQYNMQAYEASAGIVDVPLLSTQASSADWDLELRNAAGATLLREQPLRLIANTPNLYLDEGETVTASFQLYKYGSPARRSQPLILYKLGTDGSVLSKMPVTTNSDGVLEVTVEGSAGQIFAYVPSFGPEDAPGPGGLNPQLNTYMYVRVRPADASVAALAPTWANVYAHVLSNWNAMAPCMDNWLKLDDPKQIRAYGALLKQLTAPENFESYRFMPVTRDMSAGERTLLYRFLDAPAAELESEEAAETLAQPDFIRLSRAMRGPTGD